MLGTDQIDILLLHQRLTTRFDLTLDSYRALEKLYADGKIRAIGVSNFMPEVLSELLEETEIVPTVNQIEVHPYFQQRELQAIHAEHGILTQAWSPIGGVTIYGDGQRSTLEKEVIGEIARVHGKSPAQVHAALAPTGTPLRHPEVGTARIAENFDVFDFALTDDELAGIDALDTGVRGGPEPSDITLENYGMPIPEA